MFPMTEHHSRGINPALYIPGAIVVAGLIIGVSLIVALKPATGVGSATGGQQAAAVNIKDVKIKGDPYIGKENAKVVLAYWSDYQCPFCKAVEMGHAQIPQIQPSLPALIKEYVDTGKLKIVFKDYAFLSEDSATAALYGRAVWELYPAKYWEWREAMYVAQDEEHGGFGNEASILELSGKIAGMDAQALKNKVAEKRSAYLADIEADKAEGTAFGITGTPGFITGKTLIPGADSLATFKKAIDAQL